MRTRYRAIKQHAVTVAFSGPQTTLTSTVMFLNTAGVAFHNTTKLNLVTMQVLPMNYIKNVYLSVSDPSIDTNDPDN